MATPKIEVLSDGRSHYWLLKNARGVVVAKSGWFTSRSSALRAAKNAPRLLASAEVAP